MKEKIKFTLGELPQNKSDYINELMTVIFNIAKGKSYKMKRYGERSQCVGVEVKLDREEVQKIDTIAGELEELSQIILKARESGNKEEEKSLLEAIFSKSNELIDILYDDENESERQVRKDNLRDNYDFIKSIN